MARIRTIKPEFWTSAQVMECSPIARLLFIGMWNFADDAGRMTYSAKTIKAQILPSDEIKIGDVEKLIVELSSNGLILIYSADNKEYIQITGWHHQKIDKPRKSQLPDPFVETSSIVRRDLATDLILREPILREGKEDADAIASHSEASPSAPETTDEADLYRRGKKVLGANSGGLIKKLVAVKGGSIPLARSAIEMAATKNDPREYLGAIIRGRDSPEDLRARGEAW